MKGLALILILSISATAVGQEWKRSAGVVAWNVATVAVGAIGDGLNDEGEKVAGHLLKGVEVGMLISGPLLFKIRLNEAGWYISSYVFTRYALFDGMYNRTRGLPVLYNGDSSWYDRTMKKMPDHGKVFTKSLFLMVGIAIPINEL